MVPAVPLSRSVSFISLADGFFFVGGGGSGGGTSMVVMFVWWQVVVTQDGDLPNDKRYEIMRAQTMRKDKKCVT